MVQQQSQTSSNDLYNHNGHTSTIKDLQADRTSSGFPHNSYKQRNGSISTNNSIYVQSIQLRHRFISNSQSREQDSYAIADNVSQANEEDNQHKSAMESEFNAKVSTTQQINQEVQCHNQNIIPKILTPRSEKNLSEAIYSLYEELLPTNESLERRKQFVDKIERILNEEWPDHEIKVNLFGSSVNSLGTSTSDVDICVTTPWNGLKNINILAKGMKKHGMQGIYCVPKAKVPIVRLWDPTLYVIMYANTYVDIDSRVRQLAMIIKHWARQRVLNDAAKGGTLSTYTWTCMILNFLQMRDPPILPVLHQIPHDPNIINGVDVSFYEDIKKLEGFGNSNKNNESVGGLLFAFFRCFAYEFDYEHNVISLREGRYLTKEEKGWGDTGKGWRLLCVEEPFNTSRNLGNSADDVSVNGLRDEFRRAVKILYEKEGKESLQSCCERYIFPNNFNNNRMVGYYNRQGGKRSTYYKYHQNGRVNGYYKQRDGRNMNDNNSNLREKEESSKNDECSYQRSINTKYYPNSKNGNIFVPTHNHDHYNQNFINDPKKDPVPEFNWMRSNGQIYPPETIQISNYSENGRQSSELSESPINTQKAGDESNRIPTYASAHKPTIPLNNKLICTSSQKHIGQSNQKSFNIQSKSMAGTTRNPDHELEKKFTRVPDPKPVREMKSSFNHLSNINSVHDPDKQSSSNLGCQTTQASNTRPGQTYNKSANLHAKPSCHSSRPNEESNYKSYAYGGCGENNTLFKNHQNLTPPKINGGHVQLTIHQMFDKKPIHPVTATYIPPNNMSIYSSHVQNHNSQPPENFTTFQRRLSHQSSSDGSNSHTSVNSSNTSYSSNGYQQNVSSSKPRDNYYSNNHQHNGSNFGRKKRQYNNSGNIDNGNGQNFQSRNLSNESNSVLTSVNSVRNSNNSTISNQSVSSTQNEGIISNYSTSPKLNHHTMPKGQNSNGNNGGNQSGYFNGCKEMKYDMNSENLSSGQKTMNHGHHSNYLKTSTNGHSNNSNYSNGMKSTNGYQNNHYANGSKSINGGNQTDGNYAHGSKVTNGSYPNNDSCPIRPISINGSHFGNNSSNYSEVLKMSNSGANNNYANIAKSMNDSNQNNQNSVKYSNNNYSNYGSRSISYDNMNYARDTNNSNVHKTFDGNSFNASKTANNSNSNTDKKDDNAIVQHQIPHSIATISQQQETGSKQKNNPARLKGVCPYQPNLDISCLTYDKKFSNRGSSSQIVEGKKSYKLTLLFDTSKTIPQVQTLKSNFIPTLKTHILIVDKCFEYHLEESWCKIFLDEIIINSVIFAGKLTADKQRNSHSPPKPSKRLIRFFNRCIAT
ncbi:10350_t:CDS:10 [Cetraspora pellucida]|uniref:polynucleotide adenylyltransferase n=1 Tax=Cetraspora pellucida TaxID=1433469 RepID=A0A9N8W0X7_9GLOM|nr:10350_t:CDS:10 [Cetraspora pellucida]